MIKLILLGLLAGAFFSSTFILNEIMSSAGGHWFWSASLRYVFMLLMITAIITLQHGIGRIKALAVLFGQHWQFWCVTGSIGFGVFYTGICYAGEHIAGWVVAATFMFTVVASLLVLLAFGQRFDKRFVIYALLVFIGVVLVNVSEALHSHATAVSGSMTEILLFGALPALIAAFSYPIGNQLIWQASHNAKKQNASRQASKQTLKPQDADKSVDEPSINRRFHENKVDHNGSQPLINETLALSATNEAVAASDKPSTLDKANGSRLSSILKQLINHIPIIETDLLQNAFNKIWLMTLGSLPFWLLLGIIVQPEAPERSQLFNTMLVALLAGVAATSIFLYAREQAQTSSEVAGVDATQASEVIFALLGGMLLLNNALPSAMGLIGIGLIMLGLILFAKDG